MGAYKKFSEQLFEQNDHAACSRVLDFVNRAGLFATRNDDKYGPDIIVYSGFRKSHYIECEVKRVWKAGDEFPWNTIQIPERKAKFLQAGLPIEFWVLRDDLKFAVLISESSLVTERLVEVPNKYISTGEKFFQVPLEETQYKELDDAE